MLKASESTFGNILASDLWNLDYTQLDITAQSIINLPHIAGIVLQDDKKFILTRGDIPDRAINTDPQAFYQFPLMMKSGGMENKIGTVKLYADEGYIYDSMQSGIFLLIINALIKTAAIFVLVTIVFRKLLSAPLGKLAFQASNIKADDMKSSHINIAQNPNDELGMLQSALNDMMHKTASSFEQLDSLNKNLEKIVSERTLELQQSVDQLHAQQAQLKNEIEVRHQSEAALKTSLDELKKAQNQLIESEKMASLGGLVAGVAHEINTPVGTSLTGVSHFKSTLENLHKKYEQGELEEDDFVKFIKDSTALTNTIESSLERAANLVRSFKLVAVDQSAEEVREFDIVQYLKDTMTSLNSQLKQSNIAFRIDTEREVFLIKNFPGSWAQIFTNLIQNTLIHAYEPQVHGEVVITFTQDGQDLVVLFSDDGKGMTETAKKKVFDPFYTTNRGNGGSGLGMNIIFNIVTQKMQGAISVDSTLNCGTTFTIKVPINVQPACIGESNGTV
ncbi:ATP-binding protein [Pseudoalteromonas luteoviolacea]|uniref:ATP-binding protein n=1 Tax=Pseudoalteromonas luteoviolacea TaxID=43657 RepID=UPI001428CA74|nr:ATP-binding protein [Pseudoalteromonas luteoviolacea]